MERTIDHYIYAWTPLLKILPNFILLSESVQYGLEFCGVSKSVNSVTLERSITIL